MFEVFDECESGIDPQSLTEFASAICAEESPGREIEVSILLCDSQRMRKLNRLYRGKDKDTDVLTFLSDPYPSGPGSDGAEALRGDIVVDINQADRQKGFYSLETELRFLLIHGLLHLLGHDHIKPQDKEKMEHKEKYFRQKLIGVC